MRQEILTEREKRNLNILSVIRRQGPMTRADISQSCGLNLVTVSNYLETMMKRSLVFEKEFDVSEGGRRPILLDINPEAGFVVGVGLNFLNIVGVLLDLKGKVIARSVLERKSTVGIRDIVSCISNVINSVLDKSGDARSKIRGIGVGIAGIVNKLDGSLRFPEKVDNSYNYASVYVPLKDVLEKEFNLPVLVENDATSACFGEQWLDKDSDIKNLIYMFSGVGCGIMVNGEIYTGSTGSAGEVSIYNAKENSSFNCQAGNPCFLKRWEIDFGITEEAKQSIGKQVPGRLFELSSGNPENINLKLIFQAARENDKLACELLEKAAKQLGVKVAYLVNLLNPQVVVIGGGMEEAGEVFLSAVRNTVNTWAFEEMSSAVKIVYSDLGENAVALGAGSLVMRQVFSKT